MRMILKVALVLVGGHLLFGAVLLVVDAVHGINDEDFSDAAAQGQLVCAFGGSVSVWNPETGEIQNVGAKKGGAALDVSVPADSALFVVLDLEGMN